MTDCERIPGLQCRGDGCPGRSNLEACEFHARMTAWRALGRDGQLAAMAGRMEDPANLSLRVRGYGDSSAGYGQMMGWLMKGLEANEIPTSFEPIHLDEDRVPLDPWLKERLVAPINGPQPLLIMAVPESPFPPGSIILTMWESTRLPAAAVTNVNKARCVVVPCEQVAKWFEESGVKIPIRVVHLGIDTKVYHPTTEEPDGPIRFGAAGRQAHGGARKGLAEVIAAFIEAFPDRQDARLEVKCWPDCKIAEPTDPRVKLIRDSLTNEQLADWYRSLTCFVSASKGEGWGLQPHQAMGVGRPVIAPHWGGHAAYMNETSTYPVEWVERPGGAGYYDGNGNWCVPLHASLVERMKEVAADPKGRRAKGKEAAQRAAQFTWQKAGCKLADVVREFGLASKPSIDPAVRDHVNACPDRGSVLPISMQDDCGCRGKELSECRAGKGKVAGRVTLADCLGCRTKISKG